MPEFQITSPDGRKFRVTAPEGATSEDALAHVQKQQGAQAPTETPAPEQGWGDYLAEGAKSFAKGAVLSPYLAASQGLTRLGQAVAPAGSELEAQKKGEYEEFTRRAAEEEKSGGLPYMAGQILPALAAGPAGIARAAAVGAGTALATPVTKPENYLQQKGEQAGYGAAGGAIGGGIGKLLRPSPTPAAQRLVDEGVNLTPGQSGNRVSHAVETFASKSPVVGGPVKAKQMKAVEGYNRAMYNSALKSVGVTVPKNIEVGHPGIAAVEKIVQSKYDEIIPKLTVSIDQPLLRGVGAIQQKAATWAGEEGAKTNKFFNYLVDEASARAGWVGGTSTTIPGKVYQEIRSDLKRRLAALPAEGYYADDLHKALSGVIKELDAAAKRSNPVFSAQLSQIDKAYAKLVVLRRAASKDTSIDGVFSPKEMRKATIKGAAESSIARGTVPGQAEAEAAGRVLKRPSTAESAYPNFLLGVPRAIAGGVAAAPTLAAPVFKAGAAAARIGGAAGGAQYGPR